MSGYTDDAIVHHGMLEGEVASCRSRSPRSPSRAGFVRPSTARARPVAKAQARSGHRVSKSRPAGARPRGQARWRRSRSPSCFSPRACRPTPPSRPRCDSPEWGHLTDEANLALRDDLERQARAPPRRLQTGLLERRRDILVSMAENIDHASPEQLQQLVALLMERVTIAERAVTGFTWTPLGGGVPTAIRWHGHRGDRLSGTAPSRPEDQCGQGVTPGCMELLGGESAAGPWSPPHRRTERPIGTICGCCGAPGGIRTPDHLIRSQVLYPLSYGRSREMVPRQPRGAVRGRNDDPSITVAGIRPGTRRARPSAPAIRAEKRTPRGWLHPPVARYRPDSLDLMVRSSWPRRCSGPANGPAARIVRPLRCGGPARVAAGAPAARSSGRCEWWPPRRRSPGR